MEVTGSKSGWRKEEENGVWICSAGWGKENLCWFSSFPDPILVSCVNLQLSMYYIVEYRYCGTKRLLHPLTQFFLYTNMTAVSSDKLDTFCNPIYWATFVQQWLSESCCIISRRVATSLSSALTADESTPPQHAVTAVYTRHVVARLAGTASRRHVPHVYQYECNNSVPTAQWTRLRPIVSNHCTRPSVFICFPLLAFYLNCDKMWHFCSASWWLVECYTAVPNKSFF
jgi:hypothetical protein